MDIDEISPRNEATESDHFKNDVKDAKKLAGPSSAGSIPPKVNVPIDEVTYGEVNMEASITPDDVIRAGGFGARDDISSFLPVASDSTDFEAAILDAKTYEEPQGQMSRPGLGWTEATKKK